MPKPPREVDGFTALPLDLSATKAHPIAAAHYLYLKPHDPKVPDEDAPRSLFLVNLPILTTTQDLRILFSTTLEGGLVEKVVFSQDETKSRGTRNTQVIKTNRKRKRMTAEEIEAGLDGYSLPKVFESEVHKSGATAIVVFVDKTSMQLSYKAVRRAAKQGAPIPFYDTSDSLSTPPSLGLHRYKSHHDLTFPSRQTLLRSVNAYMTAYTALEESLGKEHARKRAEPDEDGFVTVTRGSKGAARMDEAKEVAERMKEKETAKVGEMGDFYRFQTRERRKAEMESVVHRFEEDKRRVEEMRRRRMGSRS